jgi:hypothetical protein
VLRDYRNIAIALKIPDNRRTKSARLCYRRLQQLSSLMPLSCKIHLSEFVHWRASLISLLRIIGAISALVVASLGSAVGQSQQREKVSEGQYQKYREGKLTREGNQSWTLWRMSDGRYELEDHFHLADVAAELLAAIGSQHLSPQLRQGIAGEMAQTGVDVKALC